MYLGVIWFAKIPATRSDFALRAFRTQSVLKGLNARPLAFSRQACRNQIGYFTIFFELCIFVSRIGGALVCFE